MLTRTRVVGRRLIRRTVYLALLTGSVSPAVMAETEGSASGVALQTHFLPRYESKHHAMGTEFEIVVYGNGPHDDLEALRSAVQDAFSAIDAMESRISRYRQDSFVSHMNRHAYKRPVRVHADVFEVLLHSGRYYEQTGGAFDVTIGPLLEIWGFYLKEGRLPSETALQEALARVGFSHLRLDRAARAVQFTQPGMLIDFGGIGKGLALDRAAGVLQEQGIRVARLHSGTSTIVALGAPPGADGWKVDVRSPYNSEDGVYVATLEIRDESVSTSSGAERFVEIDGKRYSHVVNPRTGMPVSEVLSATAISPDGVEADALSTAFCVMGLEQTRTYCETHPHVRAILVVAKENQESETVYINFTAE